MNQPNPNPTIPLDQQPLQEYQVLSRSPLFGWPIRSLQGYVIRILSVWIGLCAITGPIAAASLPPTKQPILFLVSMGIAANGLMALLVIWLYLGWRHIYQRLQSSEVVYEENGWYDAAVWSKTPEEITQHRLIGQYQVAPLLQRLGRTLILLGLTAAGASLIGWIATWV